MRVLFRIGLVLCIVAWSLPVQAQAIFRLPDASVTDTISSDGDSVVLTNFNIGGFGQVKIQTLDSYSGTIEVQCTTVGTVTDSDTITGSSFDASAELKLTAADGSTTVTSISDSIGIWDVQNAGACRAIQVISTAGFAASDTVVVISAYGSGGGSGGGGGGSSSFDGVLLDAAGGDPVTDTTADAVQVLIVDSTGTVAEFAEDPLHSEAIADWTAQGGIVAMCRASSGAPTAVTADDAAAFWCGLNGETIVMGDAANGAADRGSPIKVGGLGSSTVPSAVDESDRVNAWYTLNGAAVVALQDPCSRGTKQYFTVDITTATTTEITASLGGASNFWYICAVNLITTAANNVNLVDDNSDNCASVTASLISSGLAAGDGWGFGANGGIALGNGQGSVLKSVTSNSVLCLVTSAATELHGTIVAVPAP